MYILGITGPIGAGKSTCGQMLTHLGIPVHDADKTVHHLLTTPAIKQALKQQWPFLTVTPEVDRKQLAQYVFAHPEALQWLEALLHPLVHQSQKAFLMQQASQGVRWAALEVPLLFETQQHLECDQVWVVKTSKAHQEQRVLSRPGMTQTLFQQIERRQLPLEQKLQQADAVIINDSDQAVLEEQLKQLVDSLDEPPVMHPK